MMGIHSAGTMVSCAALKWVEMTGVCMVAVRARLKAATLEASVAAY